MQELARLRDLVKPQEILLVLDAATGQEAVNVATHFDQALNITGAILTKLDGDARGGAALSLRAVTGKPIKFAGVGRESWTNSSRFTRSAWPPASWAWATWSAWWKGPPRRWTWTRPSGWRRKCARASSRWRIFWSNCAQMKKLGSLESLVGMLPGGAELLKGADMNKQEKEFKRMEGIICAMTFQERRAPQILNAKRRIRIAKGSGVQVSEVNNLLNRFSQMQQMMKKMGKFQKMMGRMGGMPGFKG